MTTDYLTLGPTPADEDYAQLGCDGYATKARREGNAYINQLTRMFPLASKLVTFKVKFHPHDFGSYMEVTAVYDDKNEQSVMAAYEIEANLPVTWDDEARAELAKYETSTT